MLRQFKKSLSIEPVPELYADMMNETHILIGGTTGSGKSVLINGFVYTLLHYSAGQLGLIIIDPKRIDFVKYKKLPQVLMYANTPEKALKALNAAADIMERRFRYCERKHLDKYTDYPIYVIIDEFADLLTVKGVKEKIIQLGRLARAANIHLLIATQNPSRKVICAEIQTNFPTQIALRCRTAIEARQVIGEPGAELLPMYGTALYYSPRNGCVEPVTVPKIPDEEIQRIIKYWR